MATTSTPTDTQVLTIIVKGRMHGLLPDRVIKRINMVSEEYMIDRLSTAVKVRFDNGFWSKPLLLSDSEQLSWWSDYKDIAMNADEFAVNCCMIYEAGEVHGDT